MVGGWVSDGVLYTITYFWKMFTIYTHQLKQPEGTRVCVVYLYVYSNGAYIYRHTNSTPIFYIHEELPSEKLSSKTFAA